MHDFDQWRQYVLRAGALDVEAIDACDGEFSQDRLQISKMVCEALFSAEWKVF